MEAELNELKSVLRSLVVSSPTQVDVRSLVRDYRTMVGTPLPFARYGYGDPVLFLRERFADCFLFQGSSSNPVLTLIVPDSLKHIDKFVQKQKVAPAQKFKEKRSSIPAALLAPSKNLIHESLTLKKNLQPLCPTTETKKAVPPRPRRSEHQPEHTHNHVKSGEVTSADDPKQSYNGTSRVALENFMKKRIPLHLNDEESHDDKCSTKEDADSGRQTLSSKSSSKWIGLEELKAEIRSLIEDHPEGGIWCTDLIELYRERYGRELNIARHGYTSVLSLACELEGHCALRVCRPPGAPDWRLQAAAAPPPAAGVAHVQHNPRTRHRVDPDDALPGVDFDADVFPADCMHYMESIPLPDLAELQVGATFEVIVGEVYSPSHLWLIRLGDRYNIAMEDIMDEMTEYYERGAGRERWLSRGALRVGQYCSSRYEGDWHRSLIVKLIDSDTVKVRHVDYGTVERCAVSGLRPLLRSWAALPQQALRARLVSLRPPSAGRRWPHAAAAHLLRLVTQRRFVAVLAAHENDILDVMLVDTSTEEDVCINSELIRSGHADPRPDSCLGTSECYLYPSFDALEVGDTPNYAEIHNYLRDGIALDFVEEYRRHVPPCLPGPADLPVPLPPPPVLPSLSAPILPSLTRLSLRNSERCPSTFVQNGDPLICNNPADCNKQCLHPLHSVHPLHQLHPPLQSHSLHRPHPPLQSQSPHQPHTPLQSHSPHQPHPPLQSPSPYRSLPPPQSHPPHQLHRPHLNQDHDSSCPLVRTQYPPHHNLKPAPFLQTACQSSLLTADDSDPTQANIAHPFQSKRPDVTLSATECEFFCLLSQVDPFAAHKYIMETIERAVVAVRSDEQVSERAACGSSLLTPVVTEPRHEPAQTQTAGQVDHRVVPPATLPAYRADQFAVEPTVSSFFNVFRAAPNK